MRHLIFSTVFFLSATTSFAKGLNELAEDAPTGDTKGDTPKPGADNASSSTTPESAPSSTTVTPPSDTAPSGSTSTGETESLAKEPEKIGVIRSASSKALDQRLSIGAGLGWAQVKPSSGTWSGYGATDVNVSWQMSKKANEMLFITGRYTPYAGTWSLNGRYYDTTAHGFFAGPQFRFRGGSSSPAIKAGAELGYIVVYSSAQDGAAIDGASKTNKFSVGGHGEVEWTLLEKVRVGPFIRLSTGGFTIAHFGGATSFVF